MTANLYTTGQHLLAHQSWKCYLSEDEGKIFEFIMTSESAFNTYLNDPSLLLEIKQLFGICKLIRHI
jgi:hypothetical protein